MGLEMIEDVPKPLEVSCLSNLRRRWDIYMYRYTTMFNDKKKVVYILHASLIITKSFQYDSKTSYVL